MEKIEARNVRANDLLVDNLVNPFGEMKRSAIGREIGQEGFEEFFEAKHVHWEIDSGIKLWWLPWDE